MAVRSKKRKIEIYDGEEIITITIVNGRKKASIEINKIEFIRQINGMWLGSEYMYS